MFYLKKTFLCAQNNNFPGGKILVYLLCFVVALGCFVFVPCRFIKNDTFQCLVLHQELDIFLRLSSALYVGFSRLENVRLVLNISVKYLDSGGTVRFPVLANSLQISTN